MDYEKILRIYINHVAYCEGLTYIGGDWNDWDEHLLKMGLTEEELKRLKEINSEPPLD